MDCRQAQSFLALMVGQDHNDSAGEQHVRQHVTQCASCRRFHQDIGTAQVSLSEAGLQVQTRRHLWPRVAERLAELDRRPQFARFNVLVPTSVATVACLLLVAVTLLDTQQNPSGSRDLFRSDPSFAASRGELPSQADFQRWQQRQRNDFSMQQPELQQARDQVRRLPPLVAPPMTPTEW